MSRVGTFKRYLAVLRKVAPRLRAFDQVHHVDVGSRYIEGERTARIAIRIFIRGPKRPRSQGKGHRLAPGRIGNVPIDVIPFAFQRHCGAPPSARVRPLDPLEGGVSLGVQARDAATLGVVVRSRSYPGQLALTTDDIGREGDTVCQPCAGERGARPIGSIVTTSPQNMAALVALRDTGVIEGAVLELGTLNGVVEPDELTELCANNARVTKSGRSTGVTHGTLDGQEDINGSVSISADSQSVELSCRGDCGSVWMLDDGRAVALHYGGEQSRALAQAMHAIRDTFALSLGG